MNITDQIQVFAEMKQKVDERGFTEVTDYERGFTEVTEDEATGMTIIPRS